MATKVRVAYLCLDGWDQQEEEFFDSYDSHDAGVTHSISIIKRPPGADGFDVGAYIDFAREHQDEDVIVFLGSYSRILQDGWLAALVMGAREGMSAATGSWEQGISSGFPNFHLRTTAFAIAPRVLASWPTPVVTKHDCHEFEHGDLSLTKRMMIGGHRVTVASAAGLFDPLEWPLSRTYRVSEQENLLVADNRTDAYRDAGDGLRIELARLAWGEIDDAI